MMERPVLQMQSWLFRLLMYLIVYKERKEGLERLICRIYKKIVD